MDFESKYIDELIEDRRIARNDKDYNLSDDIRNYLDTKLVFVFDTKLGQEVYYLPECYFEKKDKNTFPLQITNRQYVEYRIKKDINDEKNFDAWLYSTKKSAGLI